MAMPRPSGKAKKIAEKVINGLKNINGYNKLLRRVRPSNSLSEVEIKKTNMIENKDIFNEKKKKNTGI